MWGPKRNLRRASLPPRVRGFKSRIASRALNHALRLGSGHAPLEERLERNEESWRRHAPERSEWCMVETAGFEPATPCVQSRCAAKPPNLQGSYG